VRIRLTEEQKAVFLRMAEQSGFELSAWLRSLALREVNRGE